MVFIRKKISIYVGPMQFKPMLFKGLNAYIYICILSPIKKRLPIKKIKETIRLNKL